MHPIITIQHELILKRWYHLFLFSQKNEFDNWSNMNQPIMEKILVNYLITDYISCGLSSPIFHAIFHSTLRSNSSKIQLLKMLMTIWDCLLKAYSITCAYSFINFCYLHIEFIYIK